MSHSKAAKVLRAVREKKNGKEREIKTCEVGLYSSLPFFTFDDVVCRTESFFMTA